ncbi:MAG: HD-GYP domain-containing protein [Defluviitaleaceae bacterium]|nr:HD-GYP domain-containing protein [Defluviitaleaceae bacterium]
MLIQIPIEKIEHGMIVHQDIISAIDGSLIAKKGTRISTKKGDKLSNLTIERFHEHGVTHTLVKVADNYLDNHPDLAQKLAKQSQPPQPKQSEKPKIDIEEVSPPKPPKKPDIELPKVEALVDDELREMAVDSIRNMFSIANEGKTTENMTTAYKAVKEIEDVVDKLVDSLDESNSLVHIAGIKSYDEYTYHHSLSVAILSISIGQSMGLSGYEVRQLGRCAMLHDIGKILIPQEIINKPGKLTDVEFETIKNHPALGSEFIAKWNIGDMALRLGVLTHHEKIDGTGYPNRLSGKKIPLWGQIISVADVYDAVTSYRSYRLPMPPAEAVELVMSQVGTAFDYEVVRVFIDKLELYPINTCLELSNGRFGVVINNEYAMRPIIQMTDNNEIVDLLSFENLSHMIVRVID